MAPSPLRPPALVVLSRGTVRKYYTLAARSVFERMRSVFERMSMERMLPKTYKDLFGNCVSALYGIVPAPGSCRRKFVSP